MAPACKRQRHQKNFMASEFLNTVHTKILAYHHEVKDGAFELVFFSVPQYMHSYLPEKASSESVRQLLNSRIIFCQTVAA